MPRRPGDSGDGHESETGTGGAPPAPPQVLGVHFHLGAPGSAPLHPALKTLLRFWDDRRGSRPMPGRSAVPVYALKPWLDHLAIFEPVPGTLRFRLAGAGLVPRFGRSMNGQTLADLDAALRKPLVALCDLAVARTGPVAAATVLRFEGKRELWSELMLPLSGWGARPMLLLLGCYPIDPAPRLP
ncbi:MAG: PAS domain-containing protein [Rhizomicrobium sp.]